MKKKESLEKVMTALYRNEMENDEIIAEVNSAVEITEEIKLQINKIKLKIEEKLRF